MEVRHVGLDDPAAQVVLAGLGDEYERRYGDSVEITLTEVSEFVPPGGTFVVVVDDDGTVVAGGGIRPFGDGVCEVKRMWTSDAHRRRGLASLVLSALEDAARAAGYSTVVLESGPQQPEAHAMYRARGYAERPVYGRYEEATAYEKRVT